MDASVQSFFMAAIQSFRFLETEYGYVRNEGKVRHGRDYRDAEAIVPYVGRSVGIEVAWYFAGASIGVIFVELKNGSLPEKRVFSGEAKGTSRAIDLYSLAGLRKKQKDTLFLLRDVGDVSPAKCRKRAKVIRENMSGVVEGLARTAKYLATDIITEDISIFADVMRYNEQLLRAEYS